MLTFLFILFSLATFRLTHLLYVDEIMRPVRNIFLDEDKETGYLTPKHPVGLRNFIARLLSCYWCISVWVAFGLCMGLLMAPVFTVIFSTVFALSGVASLLEALVFKKLW